jgi:hypothetical protein
MEIEVLVLVLVVVFGVVVCEGSARITVASHASIDLSFVIVLLTHKLSSPISIVKLKSSASRVARDARDKEEDDSHWCGSEDE